MKITGLGGLVLGAFIIIILSIFAYCCMIISSRYDDNDKKR